MTDFVERRAEVETTLDEARRARGAAMLDGKRVDHRAVTDAEGELAAIDAAETERTRRERAAADQQWRTRRDRLRGELARQEELRLAAIADANAAARTLAAALGRVLAISDGVARLAHQIAGKAAPMPLGAPAVRSRLGGRLAAILASVPGCRARLGSCSWSHFSLYGDADEWLDAEHKIMAPHLAPLIGKDKTNGTGRDKDGD